MYTRSEIRHACYRAKNNAATDKNKEVLRVVEPLMQNNHRWDNFASEWDIILTKDRQVKLVYPETNYDVIHTTLLKASLYDELGKPFDGLEEREYNLVQQVEQLMLVGVMTWANYNKTWGVTVEKASNQIKTTMYSAPKNQLEVTPEMIKASTMDADGSAIVGAATETTLEMTPMSPEQVAEFEKFLAKRQKENTSHD